MNLTIKNLQLLGLSLLLSLSFSSCSDSKIDQRSKQQSINVEVETSSSPNGKGYFTASGQIEASQFANISTRMMGYVKQVYVKVGDQVQKGESIIDINNADLEAKKAQTKAGITEAEAQFITAENDLNRYQTLYEQQSASAKELENVKTKYSIAKAQLEKARQMEQEVDAIMTYSNIKAPFSGVITSISVKIGDMANPGQALISLEAPDQFVAKVMVQESNIPFVNKHDPVKVYIKSNQKELLGKVSEISSSSYNSGGQFLVKIKLERPEETNLYSGMFVSAAFPTPQQQSSQLLIPRYALVSKGDLQGLYTVSSSNTAILRWLKLGKTMGDQVEVLSGLREGEQFIVRAEGKLFNGAQLNIK